jgi:hypothetical protein
LRRRVIAHHDDLDQALVAHPATPPETLVTLLGLPGVLDRPSLRSWLREDLERVEDLYPVIVALALRAERVPEWFLDLVATRGEKHSQDTIQRHVQVAGGAEGD